MSSSALSSGLRQLRVRLASQIHNEASDEQLLASFLHRREESAFTALVRRHGPMVLHVCRRVLGHEQDAEDAFQATFLVLARKAASLRNQTSLPGFLYGIVYREALKARQSAARRRKHEGRVSSRSPVDPTDELLWREVQLMLDEEIARLPEIYRSAFVLCCLQRVRGTEAARRLGIKEGTLSSRLTTARKRLRNRLTRRGVELTAVLAATKLAMPVASALPTGLTAITVKAALTASTGGSAALSPLVASSMNGSPSILSIGKTTVALLVLLTVVTSGSLVRWYGWASGPLAATAEPPAANKKDKLTLAPLRREAEKAGMIHGRVLDSDGKPKAAAKILLLGEDEKLQQLGETSVDGRFSLALPHGTKGRFLIARFEGCGIDLLPISKIDLKNPVELRLVKDQAIRGRVVNTEGKPVRGAVVAVKRIEIYANNSLDFLLTALKKRNPFFGHPSGEKTFWSEQGALLRTTTDADGRFALHGIGRERVSTLRLTGAGIADAEMKVVTRAGFDPKPHNQAIRDNVPKGFERFASSWMLHGTDVSLLAETEKLIRGIVKDADSGKARPNVTVSLTRREGNDLVGVIPRAKTDAGGRYEIHGARKVKRYLLEVTDDPSAGYVACRVWANDTAGYDPITVDIRVKKGIIITGKIIDGATSKALPGFVQADILYDNPFIKQYDYTHPRGVTGNPGHAVAKEGSFRLVTISGPVLLMAGSHEDLDRVKYKKHTSDPKYPQYFPKDPRGGLFLGFRGVQLALAGNYCKVLEIKPDAKIVEQDIVLERASTLPIRIQDAEGKPRSGVWVAGIGPADWGPGPVIQCEKSECAAYQLERGLPRLLVFFHPVRKLAGTFTLKGTEKPPITAKLGPVGAIEGRLLDADGKPLAGVVVDVRYRQRAAEGIHNVIHRAKQIVTDANGGFRLDELIPGQKFALSFRQGKRNFERQAKAGEATHIEVKLGECRDLGEVRVKSP